MDAKQLVHVSSCLLTNEENNELFYYNPITVTYIDPEGVSQTVEFKKGATPSTDTFSITNHWNYDITFKLNQNTSKGSTITVSMKIPGPRNATASLSFSIPEYKKKSSRISGNNPNAGSYQALTKKKEVKLKNSNQKKEVYWVGEVTVNLYSNPMVGSEYCKFKENRKIYEANVKQLDCYTKRLLEIDTELHDIIVKKQKCVEKMSNAKEVFKQYLSSD